MIRRKTAQKNVIDIDGPSGNAFALLGLANKTSKQLGLDWEVIGTEMRSGDYINMVATFNKYFGAYYTLETEDEKILEILNDG